MGLSVNLNHNTLGRRVFIRSVAVLLTLFIAGLFLELSFIKHKQISDAKTDLVRRINILEPHIIRALWNIDSESARIAVQSIAASPGVESVSLRAQFRINDINEKYFREGFSETSVECSERIIRDYSGEQYRGMQIGSGTLNVCFSGNLIVTGRAPTLLRSELLKYVAIATVMAIALFVLITRSTIRPLIQIIKRLRDHSLLSGEPLKRDPWDHNDEFDELFDQMVEQKKAVENLHKDDKLKLMGILATGVAHDFNNLLAIILGNAELLQSQEHNSSQSSAQRLQTVIRAAHTGAAMTRRLQLLSARNSEELHCTQLNEIWENVESFVELLTNDPVKAIKLSFALHTDKAIMVDPGGLEAALLNLVLNSRDALLEHPEPHIRVTASEIQTNNRDEIVIRVDDNGKGIPKEEIPLVTEPFYTTKNSGKGSGLGLAMVSEFVARCGGRIDITSEDGDGTSISLIFPAVTFKNTPAESLEPCVGDTDFDRSAYRVLVIDDEKNLASSVTLMLQKLGYQSDYITDGLYLMHNSDIVETYDIILSDVLLGAITGPDVYEHLKSVLGTSCPPVLFMTGAVPDNFSETAQTRLANTMIQKPFRLKALDQRLINILRKDKRPLHPSEK